MTKTVSDTAGTAPSTEKTRVAYSCNLCKRIVAEPTKPHVCEFYAGFTKLRLTPEEYCAAMGHDWQMIERLDVRSEVVPDILWTREETYDGVYRCRCCGKKEVRHDLKNVQAIS